jgi:DNA recombination-dependent growth factor C
MLIKKETIELDLDDDVLQQLNLIATENKVTIDEVIEHILRAKIASIEAEKKAELQDCIAKLLNMLDDLLPKGMHYRGQTPDWFVYSAMLSCDIPIRDKTPIEWPSVERLEEPKVTFEFGD